MRRILPLMLAIATLSACMHDGKPPSPSPTVTAQSTQLPCLSGGERMYMVIARAFLSLRLRPDPSSDRVKKLAPGATVELLGEEGEFSWVREVATGLTGYALTKYLVALPQDILRPTPAPERAAGIYMVDAEEFLSLRKEPDAASEALARIEAGAQVEVLGFSGNFAQARVQGVTGYLLSTYLTEVAAPPPQLDEQYAYIASGDVRYVQAERFLSLRTLPDAASERIAKLPPGERVSLLAQQGTFAHIEVEATGERGYVLADHLLTEREYRALPARDVRDRRYVDANEYVTLREGPSTAAGALARVERGGEVEVIGREGDFAKVIVGQTGAQGYVLDGYLSEWPPPALPSGRYTVVAREYISLREKPDSASQRIAQIEAGSKVEVLGFDGPFALVAHSGQRGYALSGYLSPADGEGLTRHLSVVQPTAAYPPHQVGEDLAQLAAQYPGRLKVASAGRSLQGRDIPVALLGNPDAPRHVLVHAGIHGREHMTTTLVMAQIEDMLARQDAQYEGIAYEKMLQEVCLHLLPCINPDGAAISQRAEDSDALLAIYRSDVAAERTALPIADYLRGWKANAAGVDLNRNFDAGWEGVKGPDVPSYARYKGKAPADQPESAALADYTMRYDFDATVSYHAYGSILYWEYGSDEGVIEQSRSLARAVRAVTQYPLVGSGSVDSGGYKDWAMEMRSIPSITIEIGTRECPLPMDEFLPLWQRNRDVLPALAAWALR